MNASSGIILIIVALLILYAAITGKYAAFEHFFAELMGNDPTVTDTAAVPATAAGAGVGVQSQADKIQAIIDNARDVGRGRFNLPPLEPQSAPGVNVRW